MSQPTPDDVHIDTLNKQEREQEQKQKGDK